MQREGAGGEEMYSREAAEYVHRLRREEAGEEEVYSRESQQRLPLQRVRWQGNVSARQETKPVSEKKETVRRNENSKTKQQETPKSDCCF